LDDGLLEITQKLADILGEDQPKFKIQHKLVHHQLLGLMEENLHIVRSTRTFVDNKVLSQDMNLFIKCK